MIRLIAVIFLFTFLGSSQTYGQTDSTISAPRKRVASPRNVFRDSAALARYLFQKDSVRKAKDSILAYQDSIRMAWIKPPSPNRPNQFTDSLIKAYTVKDLNFGVLARKFKKVENHHNEGKPRPKGELWVFIMVMFLILSFSILNRLFFKDVRLIIEAFYSNRAGKEETLFRSWPFLCLYVLFGFVGGLFLYLCSQYYQVSYSYTGFQQFGLLALFILVLFTGKILVLRLLAFLFDIQTMVKEYISILYLSYFNAAMLLLPVLVAFALSPFRFAQFYVYTGGFMLLFIVAMQFLRVTTNILTKYKFSKTYLFIYLCALEVCPLLVLIKALRF